MHKGVGLIITNNEKNLFFIQKKDKNYPIKKWIDCYSFWGGAIEEDDQSPYDALIREVKEEINFELKTEEIKFIDEFLVKSDTNFPFFLFELTVSEQTLEVLSQLKVNEGNSALVSKEELHGSKWIWGLKQVFKNYFLTNQA